MVAKRVGTSVNCMAASTEEKMAAQLAGTTAKTPAEQMAGKLVGYWAACSAET